MIYKTQILVTMSKHLNKNYLGIFEVILQVMYHIYTNVHVNLIYDIQADRSDSWDVEGGGFLFISSTYSNAVYMKVHTLHFACSK